MPGVPGVVSQYPEIGAVVVLVILSCVSMKLRDLYCCSFLLFAVIVIPAAVHGSHLLYFCIWCWFSVYSNFLCLYAVLR